MTTITIAYPEGLETAVLDLSLVDSVRAKIPVFADRRPDLYNDI